MKKLIIFIIIVIIGVAGYFAYKTFQENGRYKITLDTELNRADWHWKNDVNQPVNERSQAYTYYDYSFTADIAEFENKAEAVKAEEDWINDHNPAKIGINGKYVSYLEDSNQYVYTSDKYLVSIQSGNADGSTTGSFVKWFTRKYEPK